MPRKKGEKPVYDYNLYRISHGKADEFKDFLENRYFEEIPLKTELIKNSNGFSFTLMFCDKDNKKGSPWVRLLSACSEIDLTQELKIYGAALICRNETSCFIASFGNAHFYLSNFCDYNFGISVAERIIDLDSIRAQQNISHGSKLNKMYMDYFSGATLTYRSGEIPTYVRGRSINKDDWGEVVNCGTSAQFKWEETPLEIGVRLSLLENALNQEAKISLPRLTELDDEHDSDKISDLFQQLAKAIDEYDETRKNASFINVPSFYLLGTKIVQNDTIHFKLTCNSKRELYDGELSISTLKQFLTQKGFDIFDCITKINISVEYGNGQWTPLKSITEYIEFITEDNFCLRGGKWCSFNTAYVERILHEADKISFQNHTDDGYVFDKNALIQYAKTKAIYKESEKQPYETYYNNYLSELLGAILVHPKLSAVDDEADGRYRYEICDLYFDGTLYFVKIGTPADFAYAIDQAMLTLDKLENGNNKLTLPEGTEIYASRFQFVLLFDGRATSVEKWADILSINFLIHLNEIKQRLNMTDITLGIDFVYEQS